MRKVCVQIDPQHIIKLNVTCSCAAEGGQLTTDNGEGINSVLKKYGKTLNIQLWSANHVWELNKNINDINNLKQKNGFPALQGVSMDTYQASDKVSANQQSITAKCLLSGTKHHQFI